MEAQLRHLETIELIEQRSLFLKRVKEIQCQLPVPVSRCRFVREAGLEERLVPTRNDLHGPVSGQLPACRPERFISGKQPTPIRGTVEA